MGMKILVIHGPNLNMLGTREPEIYGSNTLAELNDRIASYAGEKGATVTTFQSNHEGAIIDHLQLAGPEGCDAVIINPGAYTHTSVAIYDAIRGLDLPVIEVHISNIHAREDMRTRSVTAAACVGTIGGFGLDSYVLAIDAAIGMLKS
jgi:3-dehydroquinate dehydratase-2